LQGIHVGPPDLSQQIAHNLVGQYLEKNSMTNTLAVFLPESGIAMPFMAQADILHHFSLHRHIATLQTDEADGESVEDRAILTVLLNGISQKMCTQTSDGGTQTEICGPDHREILGEDTCFECFETTSHTPVVLLVGRGQVANGRN
jgi:hypothetical protein